MYLETGLRLFNVIYTGREFQTIYWGRRHRRRAAVGSKWFEIFHKIATESMVFRGETGLALSVTEALERVTQRHGLKRRRRRRACVHT